MEKSVTGIAMANKQKNLQLENNFVPLRLLQVYEN
jgi:hypothetical protein